MIRSLFSLTLATAVTLAAGCGPNGDPTSGTGNRPKVKADLAAQTEGKQYLLASEPAGIKGVIDLRKNAKDGDEVVVAGQVGGSTKPFTEGRASFLIVDPSLKYTKGCDTPWDFCELPKKEVAAARLSVKFVDQGGKTLQAGARELFGIKELSCVVVKGKFSRDDKDNVVVVASGIYVRPEGK